MVSGGPHGLVGFVGSLTSTVQMPSYPRATTAIVAASLRATSSANQEVIMVVRLPRTRGAAGLDTSRTHKPAVPFAFSPTTTARVPASAMRSPSNGMFADPRSTGCFGSVTSILDSPKWAEAT